MNKNDNKRKGNSNEYDEYSRMYEQQLNKFSAMDGGDYQDDFDSSDLEFYDPNEQYDSSSNSRRSGSNRYNPNPQSGNPNGSRTQNYAQKRGRSGSGRTNSGSSGNQRQRTASNNNRARQQRKRNDNLQFGSNNRANTKGYSRAANAKKETYPKKRSNDRVYNNAAAVKAKKKSPVKRFFKWLILILLVLFIFIEVMIFRYVNMVNTVDSEQRQVTNASMYDDNILNVLVIGSDARSLDERGRTDSMILLSIDKKSKQFTMTSFMRDMYVEIPGQGYDKLNAANVYGGPELLMDTIEQNFDVRVDKYIYIDFYSFVDIVDAIGGIELEISDAEAKGMKDPMAEQNKIMGNPKGTDYLTSGGKLLLNGNQALAYARLRYVGNADFERTQRQRTVISKIMENSLTLNPFKLNRVAKASMSHVTTNMSKLELQLLANRMPFILKYDTQELRIPEEGMYSYGKHNGQSTLDVDFDACKQEIRKNIYS